MDTAVVEFKNKNNDFTEEIEIPLSITANDLIYALNKAYGLGLNGLSTKDLYLCAENPIAFLRGNKQLSDYGLRNGSIIIYRR